MQHSDSSLERVQHFINIWGEYLFKYNYIMLLQYTTNKYEIAFDFISMNTSLFQLKPGASKTDRKQSEE